MITVYFKAATQAELDAAFPEFAEGTVGIDEDGNRMDIVRLDGFLANVLCTEAQAARWEEHLLRIPTPNTPNNKFLGE